MNITGAVVEKHRSQELPKLATAVGQDQSHSHQYSTRRSISTSATAEHRDSTPPPPQASRDVVSMDRMPSLRSPLSPVPRIVAFELLFEDAAKGRLILRVHIWPHDTTESIVTTVKNFFGLYDQGISFEDGKGNTLIASYDNFTNGMTIYVRNTSQIPRHTEFNNQWAYGSGSPQRMHPLDENMPMLPQPAQILNYGQVPARPDSRLSQKLSASPKLGQGRIQQAPKGRSRPGIKSQGSSFQAGLDELNNELQNGYSSSDGGAGSVASSRKARSEQLATAEISVDNIVEGGRRKRAKFESSELPLYVPPQVPAPNSISSISPQRRTNGVDNPSPFARPNQRTFSYNIPTQPQQMMSTADNAAGLPPMDSPFQIPPMPNHGHRLRDRTSGQSVSNRSSIGSTTRPYGQNILPTPDPTVASTISDEDVALQLMRLGEVSNFSHGRMSASTVDDALSGRADAASSASSNNESESEDSDEPADRNIESEAGPPLKKQRKYHIDRQPNQEYSEASGDEAEVDFHQTQDALHKSKLKPPKSKKLRTNSMIPRASKVPKLAVGKKSKTPGTQQPMSPASIPPQSRKTSAASTINFQHQLGADEDDLSTKPRCQRCRKSKKGCDRQRPCQRCKDAGIGIEGCISEDEGNGRKGRYGRHMGVPVKKEVETTTAEHEFEAATAILSGMAGHQPGIDGKGKKRKR